MFGVLSWLRNIPCLLMKEIFLSAFTICGFSSANHIGCIFLAPLWYAVVRLKIDHFNEKLQLIFYFRNVFR